MLGKRFAKAVYLKSYHKNVWWKVNIFWPFHHPKCLEPYSYSQLSLMNSWAYKPLSPNFWSIIFTGPISILSNGYICCRCSVVKSSPTFLQPHVLQSVQFSRSVMSESATPWIAALQASLSITNSRNLPKFISIESVMPSNCHPLLLCHPLSSPSPPALNLSEHQGLFKWVSSSHQVAKVLEFQLQHQSFQWTPRTDLL